MFMLTMATRMGGGIERVGRPQGVRGSGKWYLHRVELQYCEIDHGSLGAYASFPIVFAPIVLISIADEASNVSPTEMLSTFVLLPHHAHLQHRRRP